jgi:hypothetical protein
MPLADISSLGHEASNERSTLATRNTMADDRFIDQLR